MYDLDRAARHVHRRATCRRSRPTACVRATAYQLGHAWVVRTQPVQRRQGQRVVERPADSAGRRRLEARHLRLPVPAGVRSRPLRLKGIPDVRSPATGAPADRGPSQSLLSPTTDITFTDNLTWLKGRTSCGSGVIVTRNRKDQNGRLAHTGDVSFSTDRQPELDRLRARRRAARQLPHLFGRRRRSARLLPLHAVRRLRVGHLAREREPEPRGGLRYELASRSTRRAEQHHQLRSGALRSVEGDGAESEWQRSSIRRHQPLHRPDDGRRRRSRTISRIASPSIRRPRALIPTGAPRGFYDTHTC